MTVCIGFIFCALIEYVFSIAYHQNKEVQVDCDEGHRIKINKQDKPISKVSSKIELQSQITQIFDTIWHLNSTQTNAK